MKRFVCVICLIALLLSCCSETEPMPTIPEGNYDYGIYELTFKTKKISNNFVGNDWSFTYTLNDQTVKSGYKITQSFEILTIYSIGVEVRENDKIDDIGIGALAVAICDGALGKTKVTVTETNGIYKGNTAVWEITCEVKLVGKQ